jgi:REP element-mobilizing transposase RayT
VEAVLYPALRAKASDAKGRLLAVGGIADHVHLVVALQPTVSVADFMRVVKAGSCHAVRAQFGDEAFRWQRGYAAFTVAPNGIQRLLRYVARQKQHHAAGRLWTNYERVPAGE